ncbi:MAG: hypothetical protein IJS97_06130 [Prevotella sp.]|nr:hypothetical protein [Prevotella sp.]
MEKQLIALLTRCVEQRMGRKIESPKDFERLIERLPQGEPLSMSTLKRVWQYVPSNHTPREETLDILSRFAGFKDWEDFWHRNTLSENSGFLNTVDVEKLDEGDELLLEWNPNRRCRVRKMGDGRLMVVEARNCKLRQGDTFAAIWLAVGTPFLATHIERNGVRLPDYIAGREGGLSKLCKL